MKTIEEVKEFLQGYKLGALNQFGREELSLEYKNQLIEINRFIDALLHFIEAQNENN